MPTPKMFHIQAGQYKEETRQKQAEKVGKVVRFLRENPLSTNPEIHAATGIYMGQVSWKRGVFQSRKYEGKMCWRLKSDYLDHV